MNIFLFTIDCLRYDMVRHELMPFLTKLGREAVFFQNAFAPAPWTAPSFKSIFTGQEPFDQGGKMNIYGYETITKVLKKEGYATYAVHSNPWLTRKFGYEEGFDVFFDSLGEDLDGQPYLRTKAFLQKCTDSLDAAKDKQKVFFWAHSMDLHDPFLPSEQSFKKLFPDENYDFVRVNDLNKKYSKGLEFQDPSLLESKELGDIKKLYEASAIDVDFILQEFIKRAEEIFTGQENLFIILADHGEQFAEHGGLAHGLYHYEELIHVPLIFYSKDLGLKNRAIRDLVSLLDIFPTIAELAGLQLAWQSLKGKSLSKLLKGKFSWRKHRKFVVSQEGRKDYTGITKQNPEQAHLGKEFLSFSVRDQRHKFIYKELGASEMLKIKQGIEYPVKQQKKFLKLASNIKEEIRKSPDFKETSNAVDSAEIKQKLQDLGYM
ncbi:MAG: sulfatase-like hydrolase/transferase [Candidatus Gracilibacteria bacterium]|nr:sulfatase-like hydrolase/transferase [Candidatus Gracilibacteria bacterium]